MKRYAIQLWCASGQMYRLSVAYSISVSTENKAFTKAWIRAEKNVFPRPVLKGFSCDVALVAGVPGCG
jgi:hypothetical protein